MWMEQQRARSSFGACLWSPVIDRFYLPTCNYLPPTSNYTRNHRISDACLECGADHIDVQSLAFAKVTQNVFQINGA